MATNNNAVENFEEWRKNKASSEVPAEHKTKDTNAPEALQAETYPVEPTVSALSAGIAAGVARIKLAVSPKEKPAKAVVKPAVKKEVPKASAPEKKSPAAQLNSLPTLTRTKDGKASPRTKKVIATSVAAAIVIIFGIVLVAKFEYVTPNGGINTSLGDGMGTTVLIEKGAAIEPNDLIVAVQPGSPQDAPELIIGTVFSSNEETYALYDGEVIWQIPLADLKGKVLFAEATQKLP